MEKKFTKCECCPFYAKRKKKVGVVQDVQKAVIVYLITILVLE